MVDEFNNFEKKFLKIKAISKETLIIWGEDDEVSSQTQLLLVHAARFSLILLSLCLDASCERRLHDQGPCEERQAQGAQGLQSRDPAGPAVGGHQGHLGLSLLGFLSPFKLLGRTGRVPAKYEHFLKSLFYKAGPRMALEMFSVKNRICINLSFLFSFIVTKSSCCM